MQKTANQAKTTANANNCMSASFLFVNRELLQSKLNGTYSKLVNSIDKNNNVPRRLAPEFANAVLLVAKNTYGRGVGISDAINQFAPYLRACQILFESNDVKQAGIIFQNEVVPRYDAIRPAYTPHASHLEVFNSLRAHFSPIN